MALALYRRYRPDTFDGVIGQDQVVVPLSRALDEGKLTHAYLFSGPRGCGKTSSARILARCINCVKGPTSHPCGECESCRDLSANGAGSIDVVEIDAASHNGVDDARELRERAGFAPARDRYKIFILDEAHMVTQQGFNALLKIVEEPPEHVMFIFATTEPEKVISTIRSRTHHYPFRLVPPEIMGPYLQKVCEEEKITPQQGVLKLAMRAGGGSVRDTLSVLDQLMVGSEKGVITYASASALLGYTPEALITQALDAVIAKDGSTLYSTVEKVVVGGFEPRRFVEDLLSRVRDLLVLTLAGKQAVGVFSEAAEGEDSSALSRQAKALGLRKLTVIADAINDTMSTMSGATSPRMRLELLAAQLLAIMDEQPSAVQPVQSVQSTPSVSVSPVASSSPSPSSSSLPSAAASVSETAPAVASARPVPSPASESGFNPPQVKQEQASVRHAATESGASSAARTPAASEMSSAATPAKAEDQQSDLDLWRMVVAKMPPSLSSYVDRTKVPIVEFRRNQFGGKHLVFTFDKPMSQHVFAMAVTSQNQKVPVLVQQEVRKAFGDNATIAPNTVAANGEVVQIVKKMTPQQQSALKREIALHAMKGAMAATNSTVSGFPQNVTQKKPASSSAESAIRATQKGEREQSGREDSSQGGESLSASSDADADAHRQAELDDEDPWAQPEPEISKTEVSSKQGGMESADPSAAPSVASAHPTDDELDDEDPWAQPESEPESAVPSSEPNGSQGLNGANGTGQASATAAGPGAETVNGVGPSSSGQQTTRTQPQSQLQPGHMSEASAAEQPAVSAEEDTYSLDDESLGASDQVSMEELEKIFDVKQVKTLSAEEGD
ncbi:MAG: DNA polymerase III subunit gamma/tau [Bifidobacteriaceae bacterium]|jgi:DNA polymerase-3 subunit gamma/tau|nr:DNA polymerase III subunit gamma/tau [Bifidobacteriaceae bacterium]MCI1979697.1 DNA polymerase III subunit gamma/tau [Bifidobacteriaceae bacterium]